MDEYIKREQAVTVFKTFYGKPLSIMLEALAEEHAADVRPVVLGVWEKQDANFVCNDVGLYAAAYKCNRCGKLNIAETNYCPNCGADMRGENNV